MYELVTSSLNETSQVHLPSMRKVDDGEKKKKREKKEKIMTLIVATNVIASQPPERRVTGTLTACAKIERLFRT